MATRHQNEILLPALSTDSVAVPRYNIEGPDGQMIAEKVALRLANTVSQEGTAIDKALLDEFLAASGVTAGTATAYTLAQAGYSLSDGNSVRFRLHTPSGENASLNINATGAKPLQDTMGNPIPAGIPAGAWLSAIYSASKEAYCVLGSSNDDKIGDIKETMRTDLGEEWLYCNGDVVPQEEYTGLHAILPYNAEWRTVPQAQGYSYVKAIDTNRYWMFHNIKYNHYRYKTSDYANKKVLIYDSFTGEYTEVPCPATGAAYESISGMVFDGTRFVMCVTASEKTLFYTSSNLTAWTLAYTYTTGTTSYGAYDMTYDGVAYVVVFYGYVNNNDKGFIRAVNKELSGYTTLFDAAVYSNTYQLYPCPGNRWMRCNNPNEAGGDKGVFYIYNGGTATEVVKGDDKWVEFFNNDTLVTSSGVNVIVTKLSSKTKTTVDSKKIIGVTYNTVYNGILYDANADTWTLYFTATVSTSETAYYAAHIPGTSDPTVAANYTAERIPELPQLPTGQANYAHAHIQKGDFYMIRRDPSQKNLPMGDGDTYKYIYAGRA